MFHGFAVWALFWILFELVVLVGFILLGLTKFKYTKQQMYDQAGMCRSCLSYLQLVLTASLHSPIPSDIMPNLRPQRATNPSLLIHNFFCYLDAL